MARVDVSLNGGQVPDEHVGPPRITRTLNCKFDNGVIRKTPGTAAVPVTAVGGQFARPVTFGVTPNGATFGIARKADHAERPLDVFIGETDESGLKWRTDVTASMAEDIDSMCEHSECPTVSPIFTGELYHYENAGIIIGAGTRNDEEHIVIAQALASWTNDYVAFGQPRIVWAKLGSDKQTIVLRGEIEVDSSLYGLRPHLACHGPVFAYYHDTTTLRICKWDDATQAPVVVRSATVSVTCAVRTNFDISYNSDTNRILLVFADGTWVLLNGTSGATVRAGTVYVASAVPGTYSCASLYGSTYFVYRNTSHQWIGVIWAIDDTSASLVYGPFTVCSSIGTITDPAGYRWQAAITPWNYPGLSSGLTEGALVSLFWVTRSVGSYCEIYGTVRAFSPSGVVAMTDIGFDMFDAIPAAAPILHTPDVSTKINVSASVWGYTVDRTLRHAIRLGQTSRYYYCIPGTVNNKNLPRQIATAFRGGSTPQTPSGARVGHLNHPVRCNLPPTERGKMRVGTMVAMLRQKTALSSVAGEACDVYLVTQVEGDSVFERYTNPPDSLQTASARNVTLVSSSCPTQIGSRGEPAGLDYSPCQPVATTIGAGATPAAGSYSYVVVREWTDSMGALHRSPPSDPAVLPAHTGGTVSIAIYDDPWSPVYLHSRYKVYRTKAGGSVYYEITGESGGLTGYEPPLVTAFLARLATDADSDATLGSHPILYTQGAHGGASGMLDSWGAPGCRYLWGGVERVVAGGLEVPNRVQFSNLFFPGEGVSWPENAAFYVDLPERVSAVACLDGTWIAASSSSIWAITGQGPDAMGVGTFDAPRLVSSGIGIRSWRSLVEAPAGLYFQATDGQIYLLQRGSFAVAMVSQAIRDSVDQAHESVTSAATIQSNRDDDPDYGRGNYVMAAMYLADQREVWFALRDKFWVLSTDSGTWRSETDATMGIRETIGGGSIRIKTMRSGTSEYVTVTVPAVVQTADSLFGQQYPLRVVSQHESAKYVGYNSDVRPMALYSSDIDLDHGRIRRIWVSLRREQSALSSERTPKTYLGMWYDGLRASETPDTVIETAHNSNSENTLRFFEAEYCPGRQKCNSFKFYWQDDPTSYPNLSWIITSIWFDAEGFERKQQRIPTVARGT